MENNKVRTVNFLKSLETGASEPLATIDPVSFIQHNPASEDGLIDLSKYIRSLPKSVTRVDTLRVFQDGPFVFTHSDYDVFGPKIGFDIFRFDGEKIVEHWDNFQKKAGPNSSGHTMIDGPTQSSDIPRTEENKLLVRKFVEDVHVKRFATNLDGYFNGDRYIQHSPLAADGFSGLKASLESKAKRGHTIKYNQIHKVLGEGNFVLTISEGSFGDRPASFYDLIRVENGLIAEHWDTTEIIPPETEWKNQNGKFGFQSVQILD